MSEAPKESPQSVTASCRMSAKPKGQHPVRAWEYQEEGTDSVILLPPLPPEIKGGVRPHGRNATFSGHIDGLNSRLECPSLSGMNINNAPEAYS